MAQRRFHYGIFANLSAGNEGNLFEVRRLTDIENVEDLDTKIILSMEERRLTRTMTDGTIRRLFVRFVKSKKKFSFPFPLKNNMSTLQIKIKIDSTPGCKIETRSGGT